MSKLHDCPPQQEEQKHFQRERETRTRFARPLCAPRLRTREEESSSSAVGSKKTTQRLETWETDLRGRRRGRQKSRKLGRPAEATNPYRHERRRNSDKRERSSLERPTEERMFRCCSTFSFVRERERARDTASVLLLSSSSYQTVALLPEFSASPRAAGKRVLGCEANDQHLLTRKKRSLTSAVLPIDFPPTGPDRSSLGASTPWKCAVMRRLQM